jgi:methyltransferase (TIGR00027 family)
MREGPSKTATWVAFLRGLAALEPKAIVRDTAAKALVPPPYSTVLGLVAHSKYAAVGLGNLADRLTKGRGRHMALRTRAIDDEVAAAVRAGSRQLVLLGAGLDGRAYRLDTLGDVTVFEVDHPATQRVKIERAAQLGRTAREVRYVGVDFEKQSWLDRLVENGFDRAVMTTFIWEGVTMYLTQDAIDATLQSVKKTAPRSRLLVTYSTSTRGPRAVRFMDQIVKAAGEPFKSRFTQEQFEELLAAHGLRLLGDEGDVEWTKKYLGRETRTSLERLAVATW